MAIHKSHIKIKRLSTSPNLVPYVITSGNSVIFNIFQTIEKSNDFITALSPNHQLLSLSSPLLLRNYPKTFAFIPSPAQPLVVETVVSMQVYGTLCPTLPQFTKVRSIVQLTISCHSQN